MIYWIFSLFLVLFLIIIGHYRIKVSELRASLKFKKLDTGLGGSNEEIVDFSDHLNYYEEFTSWLKDNGLTIKKHITQCNVFSNRFMGWLRQENRWFIGDMNRVVDDYTIDVDLLCNPDELKSGDIVIFDCDFDFVESFFNNDKSLMDSMFFVKYISPDDVKIPKFDNLEEENKSNVNL